MPTGSGALDFDAVIRDTDFNRSIQNIEQRIIALTKKAVSGTNEIDGAFKKLSNLVAGYFAFNELKDLATNIVKVRGEFQQLEIAFTTMLKSKTEADALMKQIVDFAAKTPFSVKEVASGAKQLLAYGSSANTVVGEVKKLGDIAAGVSVPLGDLIYLYGTLRSQGRAYAVDIRQFAGRGIPIYAELAKVLKINTNEVNAFVEAGKVGFKEVEQAFNNMTGAGGMFEGLTEKQSKSLTGLISNFSDAVDRMFNDMGKSQEGALADIIKGATSVVDNYQQVVDILKVLVATYGAYRAAIIATAVIQNAANIGSSVSAFFALARSIKSAADAQALFNLVTGLNPYVVLAAAVVGIATAYLVFSDNTNSASEAQERLNNLEEEAIKKKEGLVNKTNELNNVIRSQTSTQFAQMLAYEELQKMYPALLKNTDLDTYKKKEATQAQLELNKAVEDYTLANLEKQYNDTAKKVEALRKNIMAMEEAQVSAGNQGSGLGDSIKSAKKELELSVIEADKLGEKLKNQKQLAYEANTPLEEQVRYYTEARDKLIETKKSIENTVSPLKQVNQNTDVWKNTIQQIRLLQLIGDIDEFNAKIAKSSGLLEKQNEDFTTKLSKVSKSSNINDFLDLKKLAKSQNQIDDFTKSVKDIRDGLDQSTKQFKDFDKLYKSLSTKPKKEDTGPLGSIKYYENVIRKIKEALDKITNADSGDAKKLIKQREDAEKSLAALKQKLNKEFAVGSVKYYEDIAKEAEDALSKISPANTQEILELQRVQLDAQQKADKVRKETSVKTFEQEIEEKKGLYEQYNRWVQFLGKTSADEQFKELIKSGTTYKQYLENQIAALEQKIKDGTANEQDKKNIVNLKANLQLDNEGLDKYKKRIIEIGEEVQTVTEYIETLRKEQEFFKKSGDTDRLSFINQQIAEAEKKRKDALKDYFIESNLNEAKVLAIQSHYADLRIELDKKYADKKSEVYKNALLQINQDEKEAIAQALLSSSKGYKELQRTIIGSSSTIIKSQIKNTKEALKDLEDGYKELGKKGIENTEEHKKLTKELINLQYQLLESQVDYFGGLANIFGQINTELGGMFGFIGDIARGLGAAANNAKSLLKISKVISETNAAIAAAETSDAKAIAQAQGKVATQMAIIESAAQKAVEAINLIGATLQQKKAKQKEYYDTVINQQNEYNKLLNDEIRLKSQSEGLFTPDVASVVSDSIAAQADALSKYNEALSGLVDTGKAKDGTKVVLDVKKGLTALFSNPIGVFGAVKEEDKLTGILERYPDLYNAAIGGITGFNKELAKSLIASNALDEATTNQLKQVLDYVEQYDKAQEQLKSSILDLTGQVGEDLRNALVSAFEDGQSAANAFGDTVSKVMENIVTQALYTQILKPAIDKLAQDITGSYATDAAGNLIGDGSLIDDFVKFNKYGLEAANNFTKGLSEAQKSLQSLGFDVFNKSNGSGLSGKSNIQAVTEETAGRLEGQWNAMRITQALQTDIMRSQLLSLNKIATNSDFLQNLELLKSIDRKLDSGDLRGTGVPGT